MSKLYRVDAFRQIGGFVRQVRWDGIDCHRCRMLGWRAVSWEDPEIRFIHLRPMGSSQDGLWTGRKRHGFGQYLMGTSPLYMVASAVSIALAWAIHELVEKPCARLRRRFSGGRAGAPRPRAVEMGGAS
jgi:hypothetical protein